MRKSACAPVALAAALTGCATRPPTPGTTPKADADYRDRPNGISRCSLCHHFYSPDICEVVAGPVSRQGWCKFYSFF